MYDYRGEGTNSDPGQSEEERDETYKRTIPNKSDYPLDLTSGKLWFRITQPDPKMIKHLVEFWLNVGFKKGTQDLQSVPRISSLPLQSFMRVSQSGRKYVSKSAADAGCKLSALADSGHPLIAKSRWQKNGEFPPNVQAFHAMRVQPIKLKLGPDKIPLKDGNGQTQFDVIAEEHILKMRQSIWDKFVNIVDPPPAEEAVVVDDGMGGESAKPAPKPPAKLPSEDLTKVLWFIQKVKKTENLSGNPTLDVEYVVGFSATIVLTDNQIPAVVNPIETWDKVFQIVPDDELKKMADKAYARVHGDSPQASQGDGAGYGPKAAGSGEQVPTDDGMGGGTGQPVEEQPLHPGDADKVGAGAGGGSGEETPYGNPPAEDDIPF